MDRNRLLSRVSHDGPHIGQASRPHHTERPHLINAGVRSVHQREPVVAEHLAREEAAQVGLNSFALGSMLKCSPPLIRDAAGA